MNINNDVIMATRYHSNNTASASTGPAAQSQDVSALRVYIDGNFTIRFQTLNFNDKRSTFFIEIH